MNRFSLTRSLAAALAVLLVAGCAGVPRIDPTGEAIFEAPPEICRPTPMAAVGPTVDRQAPGAPRACDRTEVQLAPRVTVAPIGSEVVLVAGVRGPDQYLRTNERLEWQIGQGSVGQFVDLDPYQFTDALVLDFNIPRKVTPTYAITSTSRTSLRLTRGTPDPLDDAVVLRGQSWVTVTSPVEGTSYVSVFAPNVYGWDRRGQTAAIHWIDAQWQFPPPAINPAGTRHVFTTTVTRQTDQSPVVGWRVVYTITGGPPAGFAPSGTPSIEVETDSAGRASAEIVQVQPVSGTNTIAIQIVRTGPAGGRIAVGNGTTTKTWSAAGLGLRVRGPAVGSVGATLTYRLEVSNPGDLTVEGLTIADALPDGLSFLSSVPPPMAPGRTLQWQIPRLGPGQCCNVELNVRADRAGSVSNCAEAAAANGLRAKDCASTTVATALPAPTVPTQPPVTQPGPITTPGIAAAIDLQVRGPDRAEVGQMVDFEIQITNLGNTPASGLTIRDRFDPGLQHQSGVSAIQRSLGADLPPGQTARIGVRLRVVRPGRQCHTVEVTGPGGVQLARESCVVAAEGGVPTPAPKPETKPETKPAPGNNLAVRVTTKPAETSMARGAKVVFQFEAVNTGTQPLTNVTIAAALDPGFEPKNATDGYQFDPAANTMSWVLPTIAPGAKVDLAVECLATQASARACVRARAFTPQGDQAQGQACIEVRAPAPPSGLSMHATSLNTLAEVDRPFSFRIEITNQSPTPDANIELAVRLPDGKELILSPIGTKGETTYQSDGQTIRFAPLPTLYTGDKKVYSVQVLPKKAGTVDVLFQLTSRGMSQPLQQVLRQTINPGR